MVLAHSARTLMDRFNESLWSGDLVGSEEPDEQTFSQGCAAWFANSNKKALLAEIGVGTLDQAMMAVMPFKHNNLRLLGLSNKILLADEIHACDAYMSCILEGLIERQARGGNSVILLSATLSQQQRDKLVAAFARGTEGQQEAPFLEKDDYPWLTHVTKSDVNSHRVATRKDVERSVSVGWLHSEQESIARIESAVSQENASPGSGILSMTLLRFIVSCLPAASFPLPAFHSFIAALLLAIASELKWRRWHALVKKTVHSVPEKSSFVLRS